MSVYKTKAFRYFSTASASALMLGLVAGAAHAQDVPIVQPGAPGQAVKSLSATEAVEIAKNTFSEDDVSFMTNMIPHHTQAVELANLVEGRTNTPDLVEIAGRIKASQADEIEFMRNWLKERGQSAPGATGGHGAHAGHGGAGHVMTEEMMLRMGMASQDQLAQLAAAKSTAFDKLFYELMIRHHEGAVTMVEDLHDLPGSAYDPVLFEFTNDIVSDQTKEIERMNGLLTGLSADPRAGLTPGFRDAGEAISNMKLLAALPKPTGFFDPANPVGLPPIIEAEEDADAPERGNDEQSNEGTEWGERSPLLSFSNTDMAFFEDKLITGNYHGFNIYQLEDGMPKLLSSVVCPGGQGDISVVGDLLIMSVEQTRGRIDCGRQGIAEDISEERFRGLRIFDISNLKAPRQVGQVQTCRGSHTHSVVSGPGKDGKIIVYNSGTAGVRDEEELAGCIGNIPGDSRTALFRIDVIEIPVADPSKSRIIDSPAVFADDEGNLAGLWTGGDHGENTQTRRQTNQCHDITVFPAAKLAAGACSGNGIIFDISNPREPKRIDAVTDKGFAYWHSATFNNDGTKVLFTDEWGGGGRPRCRASDPQDWGADAIYDIKDGKLEFQSYYKLGAPQSDEENCVAHNGAVVPVPGRDIFVQAWYQGGISVIDFTDSANPVEIAYFDRGPLHEERLVLGGYWSTYWYDGKIYGTEIARGLDVMELIPSEHLTENELAAAKLAEQGQVFNPQQQFPVSWPAEPVVAMAYIDQLTRANAISDDMETSIVSSLGGAEIALASGAKNRPLAAELSGLARQASSLQGGAALGNTLTAIAARLQ